MFKIINFIIAFCFLSNFGFAHDSNKAFFKLINEENIVTVEAEFPWSIRKALIQFNPQLENATTKEEFISTLEEYLKLHLLLKQDNGEFYELVDLKEENKLKHSHQSNYTILFRGENLQSISNNLLFNINDSQKNYHELSSENTDLEFVTSLKEPTFIFPNTQLSIYWYIIPILPLLLLLLYFLKKELLQ